MDKRYVRHDVEVDGCCKRCGKMFDANFGATAINRQSALVEPADVAHTATLCVGFEVMLNEQERATLTNCQPSKAE